MNEQIIDWASKEMGQHLDTEQMKLLRAMLKWVLSGQAPESDKDLIGLFLAAKEVESRSPKTLEYYENTLRKLDTETTTPLHLAETDDLRRHLARCESERGSSKVTIGNIRRIISSFYSWLEDEDYIVKSLARRIKYVKTQKKVKSAFADEDLEPLREDAATQGTWQSSICLPQPECA